MLPPKVTDQAPDFAVELITASLWMHRDGNRQPVDSVVAAVNDVPLMPSQRSELVGLIMEDLLHTTVNLLEVIAQGIGITAEEVWSMHVAARSAPNP